MKRFQKVLFAAACAWLMSASACATTTPTTKSGQRADRPVVCDDAPPTGSHISRGQKCYWRDSLEDRRKADQRTMEKMQFDQNRPRVFESGGQGGGGRQLVLGSSESGMRASGGSWTNAR